MEDVELDGAEILPQSDLIWVGDARDIRLEMRIKVWDIYHVHSPEDQGV